LVSWELLFDYCTAVFLLRCVFKRITNIFSCHWSKRYPVLIVVGRDVYLVSRHRCYNFPPQLTNAFARSRRTWNTEMASFHLNVMHFCQQTRYTLHVAQLQQRDCAMHCVSKFVLCFARYWS